MSSVEKKPSALIIAPKRSGTNFTHDVLAGSFSSAVNEPLGLHNDTPGGKSNPLDPWTYSSQDHVSAEFGHTELVNDPYGSLLTRSFLAWLAEGDKLIKETDFLHLGWLLGSTSPKIVVIERDPRESIASFKKYGLFQKWGYKHKMRQFAHTIQSIPELDTLYGGLTNFSEFTDTHFIHQLAIYYAIAFLEIARTTQEYETHKVSYNSLITAPNYAFQSIFDHIGKDWDTTKRNTVESRTSMLRDSGPHGTFRTPDDLTRFSDYLSATEEGTISAVFQDINIPLPYKRELFYLGLENDNSGSFSHEVQPIIKHPALRSKAINTSRQETVRASSENPLFIAQKLVTNEQYAQFLLWLVQHSIQLSINGKPLFYNDRPQGRIRRNGDQISVESFYADHPVNFINWIGAATYCAWVGGRLPTADEWKNYICPEELQVFSRQRKIEESSANVAQYYGDTTPVTYFPPNSQNIYDALGNMSIWLKNGNINSSSYEQDKAGLEWNHTHERGLYPNPRPYWLGTSGLGLRPVFTTKMGSTNDRELLEKIRAIVSFVQTHHTENPASINEKLFSKINSL